MESRDWVSILRLVSRPSFSSLGLEGFRSRLGFTLAGYRSWSQPIVLRLWISEINGLVKHLHFNKVFVCCICRERTTKTVRQNPRNLKKLNLEVMKTFFWKISAKSTNFEVWSLGLGFQVSSLGIFDKVSISKVTISTTSLLDMNLLQTLSAETAFWTSLYYCILWIT